MKKSSLLVLLVGSFFIGHAFAQAPAGAPANATALCKDGTYYTGKNKQGACRGHKGVQEWYGAASANAASTAVATAPSPATAAAPAPASASPDTPGMVWVNTPKKVYHCPNTQWYGKTKQGEYMTEAQAKAQGFQANRGKPCAN